jgi:hypothetical protein|tara:strand:+ start:9707 stop:10594 length:888 start_codon:yes stop_codon:yes gene_type:complete
MPIIGTNITQEQYYQNNGSNPTNENWGTYQYLLLSDIINNFLLTYVGDDKVINKIDRNEVIFHAKRGLQELHYDALREIVGFEAQVPETLKMHLPHDFVSLVKISYVGSDGLTHPINQNFNSKITKSYLQDNTAQKNILTDSSGQALTGTPVIETNWKTQAGGGLGASEKPSKGQRYGLDPSTANTNGSYLIDKNSGTIMFSTNLQEENIIIEYVSDGMYALADSEIKVHKLAETFMYDYVVANVIKQKFGIQEYIVRRAQKQSSASLRNAKIRLNSIKLNELTQILRGRDKWIK